MQRRHTLAALASLSTLAAASGLPLRAAAQATAASPPLPQGPIRIWVGAPPGGSTDTLAREIAPEMGRQLGRTVLVENKSGAGGNLAADQVAKAAPDGSHLLLSFTSHTINATLYPKLPYDPVADFTPLTMVATSPSVLVAHRGREAGVSAAALQRFCPAGGAPVHLIPDEPPHRSP